MTDTARHADVVLPATTQLEHLDARLLLGPSLRHAQRARDRAARARPSPTPRSSGCWPRALGPRRPVLPRERRARCSTALFAGAPAASTLARAARARLGQDRPRPGPRAARRGRLRHADGKLALRADWLASAASTRCRSTTRPPRSPTRRSPRATRSRSSRPRRTSSSTPRSPTSAASTAPSPSRSWSSHPDDAAARGIDDGARVRVWNDRGSFELRCRVSDDTRARRARRADGLVERATTPAGAAAQATTSQRLTVLGAAPTFNDNRVEVEPLAAGL